MMAFIPARGGSKRISGKNKKLFCGRPIIEYPIEKAKEAGLFSHIIVSSDDQEIREIALRMGVETDERPPELYGDAVDSETILAYLLKEYKCENDWAACLIYSTAAFIRPEWLQNSFKTFDGNPIAVCKVDQQPAQRALYRYCGILKPIDPSSLAMRTQDLPTSMHDEGAFYWINPARFLAGWKAKVDLLRQDAQPFMVGKFESWDIDDPEDWEHGEAEYRRLFS
jgi:pseudaminic acid cytidylyltransferase